MLDNIDGLWYSIDKLRKGLNQLHGGDVMSEEKKQELLSEINEALNELPDKFRADVAKAITHDISVMGKAISIASAKE